MQDPLCDSCIVIVPAPAVPVLRIADERSAGRGTASMPGPGDSPSAQKILGAMADLKHIASTPYRFELLVPRRRQTRPRDSPLQQPIGADTRGVTDHLDLAFQTPWAEDDIPVRVCETCREVESGIPEDPFGSAEESSPGIDVLCHEGIRSGQIGQATWSRPSPT